MKFFQGDRYKNIKHKTLFSKSLNRNKQSH